MKQITSIKNEYIKPNIPINLLTMEITNITEKTVKNKSILKKSDAFLELKKIIEEDDDLYILGHNINFDIEALTLSGNIDFINIKILDTLQLSKYYFKLKPEVESYRLSYLNYYMDVFNKVELRLNKLIQKHNISENCITTHNSLYDILITEEIFKKINIDIEEANKISITPLILDIVPYGFKKNTKISELKLIECLIILRMDIDDINFIESIKNKINEFGKFSEIIKNLSDYNLKYLLKEDEYLTNLNFKNVLLEEKRRRNKSDIEITDTILKFGKYRGKDISEITDLKYLKWILNNVNLNEKSIILINKIISEN
jgi:hypothetical protein